MSRQIRRVSRSFRLKGDVMPQVKRARYVAAAAVIAVWNASMLASTNSGADVVEPGESIQAAVDAASPGDTIVVKAGTYRESIRISTNGLTLRAHGNVTLKPPKYGYGECYLPDHEVGICVVPPDFNPATGSYASRLRDVTITGFLITGFEGDGVFGFGTENFKVSHVVAAGNTAYGVASFDGVGTTFSHNAASGSQDAGIYVGDSPAANAVVTENRAWDNALGIPVRHSRNVVVSNNHSWGNCIGVLLLADGQETGSGDSAVLNNTVVANNDVCTQFAGFLPVVGGGGIVLAGSQHNAIFQNVVRDNSGTTSFSGGIVLIATPVAQANGSFDASKNNLVFLNRARGNSPADIVTDDASQPNFVIANRCDTSVPDGLCGS